MDWLSERSEKVAGRLSELYRLSPARLKESRLFRELLADSTVCKSVLLASIPTLPTRSYRPLHVFYLLITELPGPWPPYPLLYHFTRLQQNVPEAPQASHQDDSTWLVQSTEAIVKESYWSIAHFIARSDEPAFCSSEDASSISFTELSDFVDTFALPLEAKESKPVVAIVLPNGPLSAAICLAVATYYVAVPIDPDEDLDRLQSDLDQVHAQCIITAPAIRERLSTLSAQHWLERQKIQVFIAESTQSEKIHLRDVRGRNVFLTRSEQPRQNRADDDAVLLFTTGIWGARGLVTLTVHSMICEAFQIIESWELTRRDTCISMTPIYCVGGITRGIMAAVVSGGSAICASKPTSNVFWDGLDRGEPSWCLASLSTHKLLLAEAPFHSEATRTHSLRLACRSDGFIPTDLAELIGDTFHCEVATTLETFESDPGPIQPSTSQWRSVRFSQASISSASHRDPRERPPRISITTDFSDARSLGRTSSVGSTLQSVSPRGTLRRPSQVPPDALPASFGGLSYLDDSGPNYLDDDGYLHIMGTAKEYIHRNGVEISPVQVEQAIERAGASTDSPIHGRIADMLAFPTAHETLGEVVAIILVPSPEALRADLRTLHDALRASSLEETKWPQVIVYLDRLPQRRGKPLRTRLRERFGLPPMSDNTPYMAKHWEGQCPPPDTSFMEPIEVVQCKVDIDAITAIIKSVIPSHFRVHVEENLQVGSYEVLLAPELPGTTDLTPEWVEHIRRLMHVSLAMEGHMGFPGNLHIISEPLPVGDDGELDLAKVAGIRAQLRKGSLPEPIRDIETRVTEAFAQSLSCRVDEVDITASFFDLGGDTVMAEQLMSVLRVEFNIHLPFSLLAKETSVEGISAFVEACIRDVQTFGGEHGCNETYSSTRLWLLLVQLLPLVLLYPLRRSLQLVLQVHILSKTRFWHDTSTIQGRITNLLLSLFGSWAGVQIFFPFVGMLAKWTIIGRYREGVYPMWGSYHTRWWMVQKIVMLCGSGFFEINDHGKNLYCRMMGAKIGKNVRMTDVSLGEWDLLDIRDGAVLNKCQCRPFAAEENTSMYLGRIIIGERCSIGLLSVVAPGTEVLPDTRMGANSSSWEQKDSRVLSFDEEVPRIKEPHWLVSLSLTLPIYVVAWLVSLLPWLLALYPVLSAAPAKSTIPLRVILNWYQGSPQVAYNYLSGGSKVVFSPIISFSFAVFVRYLTKLIWGDLPTDPAAIKGHFALWRATVSKTLFSESQLFELNELLGHHNEARSGALRLLGAKIGKRVCWPNMGPSVGDYHLLDIGDDVTFGESCYLLTTDEDASGLITIRSGAVIADHVCILPGVTIGEQSALGFGTLTRRGKVYEDGKTFIGCKNGDVAHSDSFGEKLWAIQSMSQAKPASAPTFRNTLQHKDSGETLVGSIVSPVRLEEGLAPPRSAPKKRSASTAHDENPPEHSPYNRAVYQKNAPYHVLTPLAALGFSFMMTIFTSFYWNVSALSSMKLAARFFVDWMEGVDSTYDALIIYALVVACSAVLTSAFVVMALGIVVVAKRILVGKFRPGVFDWDKSPYCQRWQLLVSVEKLIRRCFVDKGILSLLTGTHWLVMYYRLLGVKIGKDCALFANGYPSLMITETDLIEIGDRVVIDDVGIITHVDRRGSIRLDRIKIGNRCVLRSGSNILCGAEMKDGSCLLEHTLVLPGEVVNEKWTMHRRPAERFYGSRKGSIPMPVIV
ncbi:AMP-binding enzyme [Hirsutella rhossiliensis]|uniref:AMP-binding enzyme domain-containing protein n=1 Tax=Hirsutella rhossiliensis TaxID=111463 RepID=A0A9P8SG97_9HYPO|nr:AMP-binding enzyme domain-containing protein [Hirsutella rhossiliensis]KAH0961788.1 AMP-binding enzyme domain-containing protein [Hirsutella rhossiliensis]